MIVRLWRGRTRAAEAAYYQGYLAGYSGYRNTPGYRGSFLLRRPLEGEVEFVLISFWESLEAIKAYAGPEPERANLHDEDRAVLTHADLTVTHYELGLSDLPAFLEAH